MSENMNTTRNCIIMVIISVCLSSCGHGVRSSLGRSTTSEVDQATYRYFADAGEADCIVVECKPEFVFGQTNLLGSTYILKDGSRRFTFPAVLPDRSGMEAYPREFSEPRWQEIVKKDRRYRFLIAHADTDRPFIYRVYEGKKLVFCSAGFADSRDRNTHNKALDATP